MRVDILLLIRNNPNLNSFLKYHSYWYKELLRNPESVYQMEEEMKKEYKLTTGDQISRIGEKINMISTFLEVMK